MFASNQSSLRPCVPWEEHRGSVGVAQTRSSQGPTGSILLPVTESLGSAACKVLVTQGGALLPGSSKLLLLLGFSGSLLPKDQQIRRGVTTLEGTLISEHRAAVTRWGGGQGVGRVDPTVHTVRLWPCARCNCECSKMNTVALQREGLDHPAR